jgi:hypothetical protein
MKFTVNKYIEQEIEIKSILLVLPVRYEDEDMPNVFPFRNGKTWRVEVDFDSGKIKDWPGPEFDLHMKVVDQGSYYLLDEGGNEVAKIEQDYVPNKVVPGSYGDYVELKILKDGTISNWPKNPNIDEFCYRSEEE